MKQIIMLITVDSGYHNKKDSLRYFFAKKKAQYELFGLGTSSVLFAEL